MQHPRAAVVRRRGSASSFSRVERAARLDEVVDRPLGREAEREPDVAELQVEVDEHDALAGVRPARRRGCTRRQRLADAALRARARR